MFRLLFLCVFSGLSLLSSPLSLAQDSDTVYVSDDLYTFIHAGPGRNYRILGSVTAGSEVMLLDVDDSEGYSKIRDEEKDRTGWVKSEFISPEPSVKQQLPQVREQLQSSQQALMQSEQQYQALSEQHQTLQDRATELETRLEKTEQQLHTAVSELQAQDHQARIDWMTRGGILALAGLFVGVIIMLLPRKRQRRDQWM